MQYLLAVSFLLALAAGQQHPWLNTSLPTEDRLQLFMRQLSFQQKISMVQGSKDVRISHLTPPKRIAKLAGSLLTIMT